MNPARMTLLAATLLGLLLFWPLLTQAYWPARWPLDSVEHAVGRDFVNMWAGGRLIWEGNWQVLFDAKAYNVALKRLVDPALAPHYWSYPPTSFLIVTPLALLSYGLALAVWTAVGVVALLAAVRIGLQGREAAIACVAVLLAPATMLNIVCGQNGFFSAALLGGGILLLERRPVLAGVLIGALSYKPHFGIVIAPVLLALGAWRTIAAAAATAVGMVLLSIALFGLEPWQAFVLYTMPKQAAQLAGFDNFFVYMLISPYSALRHLGMPHGWAMALQVALMLAMVALTMLAVRRARDPDVRLMLVASATFLASPYALTYDLPVLALVIARALVRAKPSVWTVQEALAYGAIWALPLASPVLVAYRMPVTPLAVAAVFLLNIRGMTSVPQFLTARRSQAVPHRAACE